MNLDIIAQTFLKVRLEVQFTLPGRFIQMDFVLLGTGVAIIYLVTQEKFSQMEQYKKVFLMTYTRTYKFLINCPKIKSKLNPTIQIVMLLLKNFNFNYMATRIDFIQINLVSYIHS